MNGMKVLFILLLGSVLLSSSCKKKTTNPVPSIPFDMTIDINLPSYNALINVGGWAYVSGGSKGIIVYRYSTVDFVAFDRHSPADNGNCDQPLEPDEENYLTLNDLCSGARFSLLDGSPISGSDYGLRAYATYYDGQGNLRIYN